MWGATDYESSLPHLGRNLLTLLPLELRWNLADFPIWSSGLWSLLRNTVKEAKKLFLPLSAGKAINWSSVCSEAGLPRSKWLPLSHKQRLASWVPAQVRISQQCMSIRTHSWSWSRVTWQSWACTQERTLKTTGENPAGHAWGILAMPAAMSPRTVLDSKWSFQCPLVPGKTFHM